MKLTEEEAGRRRCQEGFPASEGVTAASPLEPSGALYTSTTTAAAAYAGLSSVAMMTQPPTAPFWCLGSRCMSWRWVRDEKTIDGHSLGYCGKAGRP